MSAELGSPGITAEQAAWTAPVQMGSPEMSPHGLVESKLALWAERPLSDIHLESLRATDSFRVSVGFHEAAHALSAIEAGDGNTIVRVSVIPGDDGSAGHTLFSSNPDAATIGASFHLHDGGTAGDEAHLRSMAHNPWNAGDFIQSAAAEGARRVRQFSDAVREKLAHALARFGVVSGAQFRALLKQALWEERWRRIFGEAPPVGDTEQVNWMVPKEEDLPKFMVKGPVDKNISREEGTMSSGDEYIRKFQDGVLQKENILQKEDIQCAECQGIHGHFPGCSQATEPKDEQLSPQSEVKRGKRKQDNGEKLPDGVSEEGIIFGSDSPKSGRMFIFPQAADTHLEIAAR